MDQKLSQEVYVGLDTHRETIHGTAMDKEGNILCSYEFPSGEEALIEFFKGFNPWNANIALEACGIWRGCYKILRKYGYKVKLANPYKVHQLAKDKKTDKIDSKLLADLIRIGYLPEVFIPMDEILYLRDITRHKCNLTRILVRIKNKIKMNLLKEGIKYSNNLWNKDGILWLKNLNDEKINDFLEVYELMHKKILAVDKKIKKIAAKKEETILLDTIPGIAEFGATLIYSEIADIARFPTPKHLHAYAGVVPGIYQSGTKTKSTKKTEVNHWLKWICYECSGRSVSTRNMLQKHYYRIKSKKGWKTARKSTARKMLSIVWHVLTKKEPYREL